ncbi:unnamed protein product [Adineta ricciae]|uniref:Apple domain-containing protein n=1 Tax=Adineta ricciae TaxID=249248 RepID=A0A815RJ55_ADIRI|nr:unnamed protein product [Adineta ricciae]CAF1478336.1 unnamed protein product [Adineta ricciae]
MCFLFIFILLIHSIDAIILTQIHRSSLYQANSSCTLLENVTLPRNASIQTCIWKCVHQDNCKTAVYYHDNQTCLLFGENCQVGIITSSKNTRVSVICYRTTQDTYCQAPVTTTAFATTMSPEQNWTRTGNMSVARYVHAAAILSDGKILVTGGRNGNSYLNSAELYDPSTGNWTITANMNVARGYHTASTLSNGKVLVTGGDGGPSLNSAELYDPSTGNWTITGNMNVARQHHTASILSDGKILVTGGRDGGPSLNSAELYDPSTGNWTITANMNVARQHHTASILSDGKILVTGGQGSGSCLNSAELY